MNRRTGLLLIALGVCAFPSHAIAQQRMDPAAVQLNERDFVPGEVIVRFKGDVSAAERRNARDDARVEFSRSLRIPKTQVVAVDGGVGNAIRRLERQPEVAFAQPNYVYRAIGVPAPWSTYAENGGVEWGLTSTATVGLKAATDSPSGTYGRAAGLGDAISEIYTTTPVSLAAQRGCRLHFDASYDIQPPPPDGYYDLFVAGAVTGTDQLLWGYAGNSGGYGGEQISVSALDGRTDVHPLFAIVSDDSVEHDGAAVDDVRLFCRDESYVDAIASGQTYDEPDSGNYVRFSGTSMAAPHVAGVAALVGSAVPAASDTDIVAAVKGGGKPLSSLAGKTATGCTVDARGAIAVAAGEIGSGCKAHPATTPEPAPNDTFFGDLWGLEDSAAPNPGVNALEAWSKTKGAGQVIAIADTGVDLTHPDLAPNLWSGGVGGTHGYDAVDGDLVPDDYDFHGTHVAGTAAAVENNSVGIAGVAPEASIMPIRVLDGDGSGTTADIAEGMTWAIENGADVINLSLGGPSGAGDTVMSTAVDLANTKDVVVVAAAGNEANDNDTKGTTPCTLPQANLICVAAVSQSGALATFSNYGATTVDVGGPGTSVLSAKTDYGVPLLADGFEGTIEEPPPPSDDGGTTTTVTPPPGDDGDTTTAVEPPPLGPAKPDLSAAKKKIRVSKRGVFKYSFRAQPGLSGKAVFKTRRKVVLSRRGHVTFAKRFKVPASGKVTLKVKLSKKKLQILRRNKRFLLKVSVRVTNTAGSATAKKRLTLKAPRLPRG